MPVDVSKAWKCGVVWKYLKCKFVHPRPSLRCYTLLINIGPHHTVRISNVKQTELDDDTVVKTIIVFVDCLCKVLNLRNPFVLYFTKDLTVPACLSFFFETEDVHQREVRFPHRLSLQWWHQEMVSCQSRWYQRVCFLEILLQIWTILSLRVLLLCHVQDLTKTLVGLSWRHTRRRFYSKK